MAPSLTEEKVLDACRTLFGTGVRLNRNFLLYVQPGRAKSAFRRVAKETHPDLFTIDQPDTQKRQSERFREIMRAYGVLLEFFKQREDGRWMHEELDLGSVHTKRHSSAGDGRRQDHQRDSAPLRTPLAIGQYLYYRRTIPYRALIEALAWQRRQRPKIGAIAQQWFWLNEADVNRIVEHRDGTRRFGEKAIRLGLLELRHVTAMLLLQQSQQKRLGEFFVRRGYLTRPEMERLADEFRRHNARFKKS